MPSNDPKPDKPKLRWWQFRLRTFLLFMLVSCTLLGLYMRHYNRSQHQRKVAEAIRTHGGAIFYDFEHWRYHHYGQISRETIDRPSGPWLLNWILGVDLFNSIKYVIISSHRTDINDLQENLKAVTRFNNINELHLFFAPDSKKETWIIGKSEVLKKVEAVDFHFYIGQWDESTSTGEYKIEPENDKMVLLYFNHLDNIDELHICQKPALSNEDLTHIERCVSIRSLNLYELSKISDAGMISVAKLHNLESLRLDKTQVSDAGLTHLAKLKKLKYLNLRETKCTKQGIDRLKKMLPNLEISHEDIP